MYINPLSLSPSLSVCVCVCKSLISLVHVHSLFQIWQAAFVCHGRLTSPPPPKKTNKTCFHRHPATTHPLSPGQQFSRPSEGSHDDVEMRRNDAYPPAWGDTAEHDRLTARSKGSSPTPHPPPLPFPVVRYPDAMPRLRKQNGPMVDPRMVSIPG